MNWPYTTVLHSVRKLLGLSCNEYMILDLVLKSQCHPKFSINGWTKVSVHQISEAVDISSGAIAGIFVRLEALELLEFMDEKRKLKRATEKFYNLVSMSEEERSVSERSESEQKTFSFRTKNVQKVNKKRSESERSYNSSISSSENSIKIEDKEITPKPKKEKVEFVIPEIEDVRAHFEFKLREEKIQNAVAWSHCETDKFFAHYEKVNWRTGKVKMSSWKLAISGWVTRSVQNGIGRWVLPVKYQEFAEQKSNGYANANRNTETASERITRVAGGAIELHNELLAKHGLL